MLSANFKPKEQLRHRAVSMPQHSFLVYFAAPKRNDLQIILNFLRCYFTSSKAPALCIFYGDDMLF